MEGFDDAPSTPTELPSPTELPGSSSLGPSAPLLQHLAKTQATGRGMQILQEIADKEKKSGSRGRSRQRSRSAVRGKKEEDRGDEGLMCVEDQAAFYATRVAVPQGTNKNKRKQMAGTNLVYSKCDWKTQKGLDESRAKKWR